MFNCFGQLWLLTRKNLILTRRHKAWTTFELVVPALMAFTVMWFVAKSSKNILFPTTSFEAVPIEGDARDLYLLLDWVLTIKRRWCNHPRVSIAYHASTSHDAVVSLIEKMATRFSDSSTTIEMVKVNDEKSMLDLLRNDVPNDTSLCAVNKFAGGVSFKRFDMEAGTLDYRILIAVDLIGNIWHLDEDWSDPFELASDYLRIPMEPPYWSSAFLSLQFAIDSLFIEALSSNATPSLDVTPNSNVTPFLHFTAYLNDTTSSNITASLNVMPSSNVRLRRIPEPSHNVNSVGFFLGISSYFWGLCVFVLIIHTAREIASERSTIKELFSIMGLSTPVFYLSHVTYAAAKCCVVIVICSLPLATELRTVDITIYFVSLVLYGISAILFAALISSMFKAPNTVLKVTVIVWSVLVGAPYKAPRTDKFLYCSLYSLNPNAAFSYAMKWFAEAVRIDRVLSWTNLFEDSPSRFTVGDALVMLLIDISWMAVGTLLFDKFSSESDSSIIRICKFRSSKRYDHSHDSQPEDDSANIETDEGLMKTQAGISVQGITKVWSSTGERAVDKLSFKAYVGQVTVLLGHNGAGKSTTFAMISGITAPTAGSVSIYDLDTQKSRTASRKLLGFCPQANALFDRLTVDEHLWFIHSLKGAEGSYETEAKQLLNQLNLEDKADDLAKNLSGGQKRKLCLSMAIIGHSPVVLLDEPTAGMDPGARRDVESLLETIKVDRTILLTTHYMDEAEALGDRIAIMVRGRVYCCGSPNFLKKRFVN